MSKFVPKNRMNEHMVLELPWKGYDQDTPCTRTRCRIVDDLISRSLRDDMDDGAASIKLFLKKQLLRKLTDYVGERPRELAEVGSFDESDTNTDSRQIAHIVSNLLRAHARLAIDRLLNEGEAILTFSVVVQTSLRSVVVAQCFLQRASNALAFLLQESERVQLTDGFQLL
ncbi:MAG: hypothetical protein QOG13_2214 [Sphingomonadales bacterium]|nr:hypothetical protein [Sphingomonadales bacterium]